MFRRRFRILGFFLLMNFVNLFDFDVDEIGRFYNLSYGCYYDDKLCVKLGKPRFCPEDVIKVVLFGDGSATVALFQGGKLGVCSLGTGVYKEGEWEVIQSYKRHTFQSYKREVDDDAMFSKSGKNDVDIVVCRLDDASHAGAIEC